MTEKTSQQKGDILEEIVERLCSDFAGARVSRDVLIRGKSGTDRQIDVLIEAIQKSFDIKIIVEAKNYSDKVGIEKVDALKTKLVDVGGNLGVIVCPLGFTEGAINAAALHDIQLFQVFDHKLGNTNQFIPLRYVVPSISGYSVAIKHGALDGTFELPANTKEWMVFVDDKFYSVEDLVAYSWNKKMFPQVEGEQVADFGIRKISTKGNLTRFFYLELKLHIKVIADFYVKLFPASFMKNIKSGKGNHQLRIDAYSKKEDMLANGWKRFDGREEMDQEAKLEDTSKDVRGLIMTESYTIGSQNII
jgi:hypothetical protein